MLAVADTRDSSAPALLNSEESARLHQLEELVETHLKSFLITGRSLLEIRERRLYRATHSRFEDYCRDRFGIARSSADQLIRSTACAEFLLTGAGSADSDTPLPETVPEVVLRP